MAGGQHGAHKHASGFTEAIGFSLAMQFKPFRLFVLGVILLAILRGG